MLLIKVPDTELFNEATSEFVVVKGATFQIEHSLVSLSKWESKWRKPFLGKDEKTREEITDYIRCMTITQNVRPEVYQYLPGSVYDQVADYIDAPMTATTFSNAPKGRPSRETATAEVIYYWMVAYNIPMECQKWHLSRLFTLIRVCDIKNQGPQKTNKREMLNQRAALNAERRSNLKTKG